MVWATAADVRQVFDAQAATGDTEWTGLPEADEAVDTLITSAVRALVPKVIRWPILDDEDRPEETEQRAAVVQAVAETIAARLRARASRAALGDMADVVAAGGSVRAGNLSVSGGSGASARWIADRTPVPIEAYVALQEADMIGGSVRTW